MRRFSRNLAMLSMLCLASACSRQLEVKIGVVGPMTGVFAHNGQSMAQGAQIAVDELNESEFSIQGKKAHLTLLIEDDQGSAEEGKAAAQRLLDAGVVAVYGHFNSAVTISAAPIYAKAGIPQMSASTNPKYTRMGIHSAFRIGADDIEQGATMARIAIDKLKAKSVFVVADQSLFGVGLALEVNKVLATKNIQRAQESVPVTGADYAALIKEIGDSHASVLIYAGDEPVGMALLKALRSSGSEIKFIAGDSMCETQTLKNAAGTADRDYFCTVAGVPPSWLSGGVAFVQKFRAKYGDPGAMSPLAYDGIHVFVQAMQRAGSSDPAVYLKQMKASSFDGKIQGTIEFDAKGDLKDGTVVIYEAIAAVLTEKSGMF